MTADAACRGIRDHDADGTIGMFTTEQHEPYARPPLSKALWKGKDEYSIWRGTEEHEVDLKLGRRIVSLDPEARTATDDQGDTYTYERALLATGGRPRTLADAADGVVYFRTLDDYRRLRDETAGGGTAVVIGGGFIGSEIAAALASNGAKVRMIDATRRPVDGDFAIQGNRVVFAFGNCVYDGTLNNDVLTGTGRFTSGPNAGQTWNFSVRAQP